MTKEKKLSGINVSHLTCYNGLTLIISTFLFIIAIWMPSKDPYYIFLVAGGFVLFVSYSITAATSFRLLFIADPQKISMLISKNDKARIAVFPFILDKRTINVYVSFITFNYSKNYKIVSVNLDGNPLIISNLKVGSCEAIVEVDSIINTSSRFEVYIEMNPVNLTSRFFEYCLFYSKKKTSRFLKFKENHIID